MSATNVQPKGNEISVKTRLPYYQINPSYTLRVVCCVLFIFLTEICLAHYIYRLINTEIREEYLTKRDFEQNFLNALRTVTGRDELVRIFREFDRYERGARNSSREKRDAYVLDDDGVLNVASDGPTLDYINFRSEIESKGEDRAKNGGGGGGGGKKGDVWLTTHNRISIADMQKFCSATKDYCVANPGNPGNPGAKGDRGETGFPGIPGPMGPRGYPGLPGEKGAEGRPGLDGVNGVPGEPGIDGSPGRNGLDGRNGEPGTPGRDGRNGTDGQRGAIGPPGPPGPQGPKGAKGPRGKMGIPGFHGTNGIPGVSAWKTKVNGSDLLLIPPSIAGNEYTNNLGHMIVEEGDNIKFACGATGVPMPHITWRRANAHPITNGPWQEISVVSNTFNITGVNRHHMGQYMCIANNGVPPEVNQTFFLEVHFKPLIRIRNQDVGAYVGSTVTMECEVESFPESVKYWKRADGLLLENSEKYRIENSPVRDGFRTKTMLTITRINGQDFTDYYCAAKNERDFEPTKGYLKVYEINSRTVIPPPIGSTKVVTYGPVGPPRTSYDTICPPQKPCRECPERDCKDMGSISLFDLIGKWEINRYGNETHQKMTVLPERTTGCELYAIGKPVYHRYSNETYGCWMRDPSATEKNTEKYWATKEGIGNKLLEFDNKAIFRSHVASREYDVDPPIRGNAHVIYNGCFYYAARDRPDIVKYNFTAGGRNTTHRSIPHLNYQNPEYLYSTRHNFMDFNVDDNGLWVIFAVPDSNNTGVIKFDEELNFQYMWNISLNHHKVGEMFIVCGVLYAVDSVTDTNTRIRFALDLYKNNLFSVNLVFTNPFKNTTMIGYNHKNKELYTWDKGNQLTYPVRYHETGHGNKNGGDKDEKDSDVYPEDQGPNQHGF